jgi:hypothetical protein
MLNVNLATRKRRQKINFGMVEQIVIFPLEPRVGLLLDLENDVSRLDAGQLVALASEFDLVA